MTIGKPEDRRSDAALDRIREMFDRAPIALTLADAQAPDMPLVVANQAFLDLTGYNHKEVIGRNCRFLQSDLDNVRAKAEIRICLSEFGNLQVVLRNRRKSGEAFDNLLFLQALVERDGRTAYFLGSQFELQPAAVSDRRINRHMAAIDAAVEQAVQTSERLRREQRRMLANAAHSVANAWLALR